MKFLKNMTIKVELFAGTDILDAVSDMCELANRVGVMIEANFNDVKIWARPGNDPKDLVVAYHVQCTIGNKYKIAQVRLEK